MLDKVQTHGLSSLTITLSLLSAQDEGVVCCWASRGTSYLRRAERSWMLWISKLTAKGASWVFLDVLVRPGRNDRILRTKDDGLKQLWRTIYAPYEHLCPAMTSSSPMISLLRSDLSFVIIGLLSPVSSSAYHEQLNFEIVDMLAMSPGPKAVGYKPSEPGQHSRPQPLFHHDSSLTRSATDKERKSRWRSRWRRTHRSTRSHVSSTGRDG